MSTLKNLFVDGALRFYNPTTGGTSIVIDRNAGTAYYYKSNGTTTTDPSSIAGMIAIGIRKSGATTYGRYNTTYIGAGSSDSAKKLILGVGGTIHLYATSSTSGFTGTSDVRDKADIKYVRKALKFINKITPLTYVDNSREKYNKKDEEGNFYFDEENYLKGTYKGERRSAGFKAQEVHKALKHTYHSNENYAAVVDYTKYDDPNAAEDRYYMRYQQMVPFLTRAIQELSEELSTTLNEIDELSKELEALKLGG